MKSELASTLWAEWAKVRRSPMLWLTPLGFALGPLVGGVFMLILKDPAWARQAGLLSTKAQLRGSTADWPSYWGLVTQATAVGGLFVFGLITIWLFGREYTDRTVKDLLALPIARETIVAAKLLVAFEWTLCLAVLDVGLALGVGSAIGLPGWSTRLALTSVAAVLLTAALTWALTTPFAWVASIARGYLAPVGVLALALFFAQVIAATGWGAYFPWTIPGLVSGVAGPESGVGVGSYLLVLATGAAGAVGVAHWWRAADYAE